MLRVAQRVGLRAVSRAATQNVQHARCFSSDEAKLAVAELAKKLDEAGIKTLDDYYKMQTGEISALVKQTQEAAHSAMMADWTAPSMMKPPVKVAVTGAAGAIGYAALFRIASGAMLGADQPVELSLLDLEPMQGALEGVKMELLDCAFPTLTGVSYSSSAEAAFEGADYALLIGAKPRGPGMERADLLQENAKIFSAQGKALNSVAKSCLVTVVGNPANTNALIASSNAPDMAPEQFSALTRLDQTRAEYQIAAKAGVSITDVKNVVIWGNHSPTMYADITKATIGGKWAKEVITDEAWLKDTFVPTVGKRGAAIIGARGASSAASAAAAAIEHTKDWALGSNGRWVSMGVPSDGSYGVDAGIYYSVPVICYPGSFKKIGGLEIDPYSAEMMEITRKELEEEKAAVASLL